MSDPHRLASLRVLAVPDPLPEEAQLVPGDATKGLVVIAEVDGTAAAGTGVATVGYPRGLGARERSWELAEAAADALFLAWNDRPPTAERPDVDAAVRDAVAHARGRGSATAGAEDEVVRSALTQALRRALDATGVDRPPGLVNDLLALLAPLATNFHVLPAPPPTEFGGRSSNEYPELRYLRPLGVNGTKGHLLERQALAYGFSTVRYSKGAFLASRPGGEDLNFKWSRSPISGAASIALCNHKEATRIRLRKHGIPTPRGRMFVRGDFDEAVSYAHHIGFPVVCKPAAGVRGIGVVAGIGDEEALHRAFDEYRASRLGGDDFIVEKHVHGGDYRIVVVDGEVIAAILREPASVVGDGVRSIAELVLIKNQLRRQNPHLWGRLIKLDEAAFQRLARRGLTLTSVPDAGVQVTLSDTCSLSQGGDSVDILDELHPTIAKAAIEATRAIPGLRYCGVDFLLGDHRVALDEQREAGICELNAHAAIGNGEYPMFGAPRQVARELFVTCAEDGGHQLGTPAESLTVRLEVRGRVTKVGFRRWFAYNAERAGAQGWVRNAGRRRIEAVVSGPTQAVSALCSLAVLGPRRAIPTSTRVTHTTVEVPDGFEVRR